MIEAGEDEIEVEEVSVENKTLTINVAPFSYMENFNVIYISNEGLSFAKDDVDFDLGDSDKFIEGKNDVLPYRLFVPETDLTNVPLVLYLHGAGAIGEDNITQIIDDDNATSFVTKEMQEEYASYVLAPQLPTRFTSANDSPTDEQSAKGWTDEEVQESLIEMIQELEETYGDFDKDRIYITGHSMGGLGV